MTANQPVPDAPPPKLIERSVASGALIGIGTAGFIDETVFHQILHWHHFYDKGSASAGLISDGFFHAGSWLCIVTGLFIFADLQRRRGSVPKRVWAGAFLGWGAFQIYDGLLQHKAFGLHQIRYHVAIVPYDVAWNVAGASGVAVGVFLLFGAATSAAEREATTPVPS